MGITIIRFKDLKKEHQDRFRKEWDKDPKNYDEPLDDNQLVMVDVEELNDLMEVSDNSSQQ